MKNYEEWLVECGVDSMGGVVPQDMGKAKKVDLITLPEGVKGTNCFNCRYVEGEGKVRYCDHPEVEQWVNERNCCAEWDHRGVKRPWH